MKKIILFYSLFLSIFSFSQNTIDKGLFEVEKDGFYENEILKDATKFDNEVTDVNDKLFFKASINGKNFPNKKEFYKEIWHNEPVCQGNSGTCWCYATTSFMESEAKRINGIEVKLSEMFTVYYEYIERAKNFVKTRGNTTFSEGSEAAAIPRIWGIYGIVPYSVYEGKPIERKFNSHRKIVAEMTEFLNNVKETNNWNEEYVVKNIKSILNSEMGEPPVNFKYENKDFTPQTFLSDYLKLNMIDYVNFMSTNEYGYNEKHELIEDDNWWHCNNYYNIELKEFINTIRQSVEKGYSVCICGDISEPGYSNENKVAFIPDFDIPSDQINEDSRQFRLKNNTTTDDHCIHIVGYYNKYNKFWYLIKDSNGNAFDGDYKGYRFFSEDYIKLKMMNIMVNKNSAKNLLDKIIK